jgi:predicted Rossmann fold nucleotide-binding protein DprA/Smf involved in DNA uptake
VAGETNPFTLSEWNKLARQIQDSPLKRPAGLQGWTASDLARELAIRPGDAERIAGLLDRSGRLALELEGLFSRGMWAVSRMDEVYPKKLRDTLRHQAPTVLFGAGDIRLMSRGAIAVIGSRNIDEAGTSFAAEVGRRAAAAGSAVVSGGARGTDRLAMGAALEGGGQALGVLADSLEKTVRQPDLRQLLLDGQLALATPYVPSAGFSVGGAMGRNKIIYGLADFAIVVSSDFQTGGTWAGAVEALKAGWCPVFARDGAEVPKGNRELLKLGAAPMAASDLAAAENLTEWLRAHARRKPVEQDLFG